MTALPSPPATRPAAPRTAAVLRLPVTPCPAPRMTAGDRRRPIEKARPRVARYFQFRDDLQNAAAALRYVPGDTLSLRFILPMPTSWNAKKRAEMDGQPHQVRPDLSNLVKATEDALYEEDGHIWRYGPVEKVWGREGAIEILSTEES